MKDFDSWNFIKNRIDGRRNWPHCREREIWWCSIGMNIGSEKDGKNALYERSVLVLKVFSRNTIRIVPLTSKSSNDKFGIHIYYHNMRSFVLISQIKSISLKRLIAKIATLEQSQFELIKQKCIESF